MKTLKGIIVLGLGFLMIQSCSSQDKTCECLDVTTAQMKGDREHNYDGTFIEKYTKENFSKVKACEEYAAEVTDASGEDEMMDAMRKCPGFKAFTEEVEKEDAFNAGDN